MAAAARCSFSLANWKHWFTMAHLKQVYRPSFPDPFISRAQSFLTARFFARVMSSYVGAHPNTSPRVRGGSP
jgi:hypothetical protein